MPQRLLPATLLLLSTLLVGMLSGCDSQTPASFQPSLQTSRDSIYLTYRRAASFRNITQAQSGKTTTHDPSLGDIIQQNGVDVYNFAQMMYMQEIFDYLGDVNNYTGKTLSQIGDGVEAIGMRSISEIGPSMGEGVYSSSIAIRATFEQVVSDSTYWSQYYAANTTLDASVVGQSNGGGDRPPRWIEYWSNWHQAGAFFAGGTVGGGAAITATSWVWGGVCTVEPSQLICRGVVIGVAGATGFAVGGSAALVAGRGLAAIKFNAAMEDFCAAQYTRLATQRHVEYSIHCYIDGTPKGSSLM